MITREQQVGQSVQEFIAQKFVGANYGNQIVKVRDAFPTPDERAQPLTTNLVCLGFNFDDGGKPLEMGSDLTLRVYTIEFWTFGRRQTDAENIATVIRTFIEDDGFLIPLKDIEQPGKPVVDQLIVRDGSEGARQGPQVQRQVKNDPLPGERFVFSTIIRVEDTYFPSLVN